MDEKVIVNPHASFFQKVFTRLDIAADLIKNYLPENIVNELNLKKLELDRENFVDLQI